MAYDYVKLKQLLTPEQFSIFQTINENYETEIEKLTNELHKLQTKRGANTIDIEYFQQHGYEIYSSPVIDPYVYIIMKKIILPIHYYNVHNIVSEFPDNLKVNLKMYIGFGFETTGKYRGCIALSPRRKPIKLPHHKGFDMCIGNGQSIDKDIKLDFVSIGAAISKYVDLMSVINPHSPFFRRFRNRKLTEAMTFANNKRLEHERQDNANNMNLDEEEEPEPEPDPEFEDDMQENDEAN